MTPEEIRLRFNRYLITGEMRRTKRYRNIDDIEVQIPPGLEGEILLEERYNSEGKLLGWLTISPENLSKILTDPALMAKEAYAKYIEKWKEEGIL